MNSPFSKMMDYHVQAHFRRDPEGRLVFLPFGARKKAYYVDSKLDEEKIKSFVKLYRSAGVLFSWMTFPVIYAPGFILTSFGSANPLKAKLEAVAGTSLIFMLVFLALFWMLWSVYKRAVPAYTASLSEVEPEFKGQLSKLSETSQSSRRVLLFCLFGALILMGGMVLATSRSYRARRPSSAECPATALREQSHPASN